MGNLMVKKRYESNTTIANNFEAEAKRQNAEINRQKEEEKRRIEEANNKKIYDDKIADINFKLNNLKLNDAYNQKLLENIKNNFSSINQKISVINDYSSIDNNTIIKPDISLINADILSFKNNIENFHYNINSSKQYANIINNEYGNIQVTKGGFKNIYDKNRMEELKYENIINNLIGGMKKIKIEKKDGSKIIIKKDKKGNNKIVKK